MKVAYFFIGLYSSESWYGASVRPRGPWATVRWQSQQ